VPFAAALSEHPVPSHAIGEVVGQVLEQIGDAPDLAVLFVGRAHTGALEDMAAAVRALLRPSVLIGCTTSTVVGGGREVEDAGGVSLFVGRGISATPVRLRTPADAAAIPPSSLLLVLADPFTFATDELLATVAMPVAGGLASAAHGPGGNRLVLDDRVLVDGAVAVAIDATVETVVSQGCRPIGAPMIITSGEGTIVRELAGQPALRRVQETLGALGPDELALARKGLHIGRVVDESKPTFDRGDFVVRGVLGADRATGAVAVGDEVEVGATVQLHVRDAATAEEDLRHLLVGRDAAGALVFTCNGRGTSLFGVADHDASLVAELLDRAPIAGMSCAGEIGPVGGRSFLHGFTASLVLFSH
jgi:small ligand-binding sensory domain FIST